MTDFREQLNTKYFRYLYSTTEWISFYRRKRKSVDMCRNVCDTDGRCFIYAYKFYLSAA